MRVKVTAPDGTTATITETTACIKGSQEKCMVIDKNAAEILIDYAAHQGWKVEKIEA